MRDVREVLQEKLKDLTRVTREINALRIVIPLMEEPSDPRDVDPAPTPEKAK